MKVPHRARSIIRRFTGLTSALALATTATSAAAHGDGDRALPSLVDSLVRSTTGSALDLLGGVLHPLPPDEEWESAAEASYTLFESGQVRPLALSPDGELLFATNTPDGRLEVFQVRNGSLRHRSSIPVGLEPVAVAARSSSEVWVVNHVSDSVSVVELSDGGRSGSVVRTLLVGDEPRDVVFAGPGRSRAFVTTAHRGQNSPIDPQLTAPGVGRADVWVFDADAIDDGTLGGTPETIVTLFTDTPRALAVSPDGGTVYAAGFHTGNRTATLFELYVPDGGELLGGIPGPRANHQGVPAPETGMILRWDGEHWRDELGRELDEDMRFSLPDWDVFAIDANADPPTAASGPEARIAGVGTVLFNMVTNPVTGALYVSNTDANNMDRFEGPGELAGRSLRGHLHESHITVVQDGAVLPRHLNKHIDYEACCDEPGNDEAARSLAFPLDMQVSSDGQTLYVAALGSSKVGIFDTRALEADTFVPSASSHVEVSGGGPTGLALDEKNGRLYALTRFDNAIAIIDARTRREVGKVPMHDPEPARVKNGRRFLYDARLTSSHGDSACASCHVFGDLDSLAWDLGNPDADVALNLNPMTTMASGAELPAPIVPYFHPMKGPMTTQSLRGMDNHGPMHWRGDRTGAGDSPNAQPDSGAFDERAAFMKFNPAFPDLIGNTRMIPDADMEAFTDFVLALTYPPNPVRNLDDSLTADQARGREIFFQTISTGGNTCQQCHQLSPRANEGLTDRPGLFGTNGTVSFDFEQQLLKIPHFRNIYTKVGRFGQGPHPILLDEDHEWMGDQIRGFGFTHDGGFDTLFRFDGLVVLQYPEGDRSRRQLEQFFFAFDSNLAPAVGQQVTLGGGDDDAPAAARAELLVGRAEAGQCDVTARSRRGKEIVGWLYVGDGSFVSDRSRSAPTDLDALRAASEAAGEPLTLTCAPPGSGVRTALDRDLDGAWDGDERDALTDPADPTDRP